MTEKETTSANIYDRETDAEEFGEIAHERHEAIREQREHEERKHKDHQSSEREIVAEAQELAKEASDKKASPTASPAERRRGPINKRQLESSFESQMKFAKAEMRPSERVISKIIHNKTIEKTSDIAGSTVARPNAMLSGSIFAFVGVTILYFVAKYYGFHLSGFETVATFIFGWIIGMLYDYFSIMIRGRNK